MFPEVSLTRIRIVGEVDINDLASHGVINDVPGYMLPPEAWTQGLNIRFWNGAPETVLGWESVFGTPIEAPHFIMPIPTQATNYWIYAGATKIMLYDGSNHTDISRSVGGAYTMTDTRNWNSTMLGGIPIFNNTNDVPQYRADMSVPTKFENLPNWPSTLRAKVIRAFKPILLAFNLTDSGVSLPHTVQWSHPADPGTIPSSWDPADPTKDTGRKDFEDTNAGILRDALPLGGTLFVYKDNSTWRGVHVGGRDVFDWKPLYETSGILAPRCVSITGDGARQFVVTQDDAIFHKGGEPTSILDKRQRSTLFGEIDTTNYINSFMFPMPLRNEMWFCYPTIGNTHPNKAMVWNYREGGERGVISFVDGITFRNAAIGNLEGDSSELWSTGTDNWDEDTGPWSEFTRRRVVAVSPSANKFYNLDRGNTQDGVSYTSTLQRTGLGIIGKNRAGPIVDFQKRKLLQRLWPKIQGGSVSVRFASQELVDGPITWGPPVSFDPSLSRVTDNNPIAGAAIGFEVSQAGLFWRMDGYKLQVEQLGIF